MIRIEIAYAVQSIAESHNDKVMQCGHWVGNNSPDIMKAFTNASSLQSKLRTLGNHVDDDATVDVPGVIISLLWRPCKHELYLFGHNKIVYIGLPKVVQTECRITKFAWVFCIGADYFMQGSDYSYRRGLRSCLSVRGGKFEGQDCEISNEYESHAFSLRIGMTFALI